MTIWDEWADAERRARPGLRRAVAVVADARRASTIDQIAGVIDEIRRNPDSRRLIVSAWNPADIPDMALAPCHALFQFYVADGRLSCQLYQRSADLFLGVPFNIASYALLTHMVAQQTGLEVGDFVWTGGDCHIYDNHVEQVPTAARARAVRAADAAHHAQARRRSSTTRYDDFVIEDYQHHPAIRGAVAV